MKYMFKRLRKILITKIAFVLSFFISIYRKFNPLPPRICFCYNQSIHQIYHSIFIAIELSNIQNDYEVVIYSTSHEASMIIEKELSQINNKVKFIKIYHPGYRRVDFAINWFVFLCWLRMYRPSAVVVTDYFDNVFRQLLLKTFWVHVPHGIFNRAFSCDPHMKNYELLVLSGEHDLKIIRERLGPLNNCQIGGYSKFDYFHYHRIKPMALFATKRPIILYNPHFDQSLSSFFDKGLELLTALSANGRYNIIFMPHPDLIRKHRELVKKARGIVNVFSVESHKINLEYMAQADIYITDVSSSAYEWLHFDKPVLFFNTKRVDWKKSKYYPSWVLGEVVEEVSQVITAAERLINGEDNFKAVRKEMFESSFANNKNPVSKNIALEIYNNLKKR